MVATNGLINYDPSGKQLVPTLAQPAVLSEAATYKPTSATSAAAGLNSWKVDAPQTVSGQVKDIISANSPLMQQAETNAKQAANSRGLLNSSLAVGAAQDAVIRTALPIAQQDAQTNASAAHYNADTANTTARFNAGNEQQVRLANMQAENSAGSQNAQQTQVANQFNASQVNDLSKMGIAQTFDLAKMDKQVATALQQMGVQQVYELDRMAKAQGYNLDTMSKQQLDKLALVQEQFKNDQFLANLDATTKSNIAQLDASTREFLGTLDSNTRSLIQTSANAATLFDGYVSRMAQISVSPDLDVAGKTNAIANLRTGLLDSMKLQGAIANLDLAGLLV